MEESRKYTKEWFCAAGIRAFRTLIQAAASAALVSIGSAETMGEVDCIVVISTASLAAIASLLTSIATGIPEIK